MESNELTLEEFVSAGAKAQAAVNALCNGNNGTDKTDAPAWKKMNRPALLRRIEALEAETAGSLINRRAVEALALDLSHKMRRGKFTRVSKEFLDDIEAQVRTMVNHRVHRAPGVGKTL